MPGPPLPRPVTSNNDDEADGQIDDYVDFRDFEHQDLPDYATLLPTGCAEPIAKFLADMPDSIEIFQDGLMKEVQGLPMHARFAVDPDNSIPPSVSAVPDRRTGKIQVRDTSLTHTALHALPCYRCQPNRLRGLGRIFSTKGLFLPDKG